MGNRMKGQTASCSAVTGQFVRDDGDGWAGHPWIWRQASRRAAPRS